MRFYGFFKFPRTPFGVSVGTRSHKANKDTATFEQKVKVGIGLFWIVMALIILALMFI